MEHAASVQAEAIATEEKSKQVFTKQLETVENMLNINIDSDLEPLRMSVQEMQELEHTIQDYTTQVQTILQQLQQLTIQLQGQAEPNIVPLETEYIQLQQQHDALSLKIGAQTQQLENSQKSARAATRNYQQQQRNRSTIRTSEPPISIIVRW